MGTSIHVNSDALARAAADLSAAASRMRTATNSLSTVTVPPTWNAECDQALSSFHNVWALYDLPRAVGGVVHLGTALGLAARGYDKADDQAMRVAG